ncbi:MAG: NrsF family protein [Myxococcota bacterium]
MSTEAPTSEPLGGGAADAEDLDRALRARILGSVAAELSPPRRAARPWKILALLGGFALAVVVLLVAGIHVEPRPTELVLVTLVGALALAGLGVWLALGLGRSMLGRPTRVIVAGLLALPILLFAWKTLWSVAYPDMDAWVAARPGFRCLGLSLLGALGPVTAFLWMKRRALPRHPGAVGAALGMAAGASSWALLDLYCPVGNAAHLLLGHVLPMLLLAAGGYFIGRRVFRPEAD